MNEPDIPFWKRKTLRQMTTAEWESLCDGCARCCLNKFDDPKTGRTVFTDVACRLLDPETCRCASYADRQRYEPTCRILRPDNVAAIDWLPATCAYRLVAEGKDLAWWHPLLSGTWETVEAAGISVKGRTVSERDVADIRIRAVDWLE